MQRLLQLRHKLHANPRVSNNEAETAAWLQEFMGAHSLQPSMSNVGGNAHRIAVPHFFFNSCINITRSLTVQSSHMPLAFVARSAGCFTLCVPGIVAGVAW